MYWAFWFENEVSGRGYKLRSDCCATEMMKRGALIGMHSYRRLFFGTVFCNTQLPDGVLNDGMVDITVCSQH
jgi:hypothetical protein